MKSRSAGSCITSGCSLYADNFRKTFRFSWPAALLYAIVFSVLGTIGVVRFPAMMTQMLAGLARPEPYTTAGHAPLIAAVAALIVIGGLFEVVFYSYGVSLLRIHSQEDTIPYPSKLLSIDRHTAWRTIKAALCSIVICAIPAALLLLFFHFRLRFLLAEAGAHILTLSLTAVVIIAIVIFLLPLSVISIKYVMRDETRLLPLLREGYSTGLRHLPLIVCVMFVNLVAIAVASYVILQPAVVLLMANTQANLGTIYGDPLGMPEYIVPMTAFVFLIAGFLQAYIRMSALFTTYYLYGSIETRDIERKQYKDRTGDTDTPQ